MVLWSNANCTEISVTIARMVSSGRSILTTFVTGNIVHKNHASESEGSTRRPCQLENCSRLYNPMSGRHFPAYLPLCDTHRIGYRAGDIWQCVQCAKYVSDVSHNYVIHTIDTDVNQIPSSNSVQKSQVSESEDAKNPYQIEESSVFHEYCQEEGCKRLYKSDSDFPLCEEHIADLYWSGKIWRCIECNRYTDNINHSCSNSAAQDQARPHSAEKRQAAVQEPNLKGITAPTRLSDKDAIERSQVAPPEETMSPCELEGCTRLRNNSSDAIAPLCSAHLFDYQDRKIRQCERCGKYSYTRFTSCVQCSQFVPERSEKWAESDANATEFYVYFLQLSDGSYYPGQTNNLTRRIQEHQSGKTKSTAGRDPQLVWYNIVDTREQASNLELQLKHMRDSEIKNMITQFNLAIRGHLPNLVTTGDMSNLEHSIRQDHAEYRKDLDATVSKIKSWIIVTGIILAGLIVAFNFWI